MLLVVWEYIDKNTTKREVMRSLSKYWGDNQRVMTLLEKAYNESSDGHGYDTRDSGERYFRHVLGVVSILLYLFDKGAVKPNYHLVIAAFFHDLPEDKSDEWSIQKIKRLFGKIVARLVNAVTKPPYTNRHPKGSEIHALLTFDKVKEAGEIAIILKIADRLHNMLTLWGSPEKKNRKILETIRHVFPLAVRVNVLVDELLLATAQQKLSEHIDNNEVSEIGHDTRNQ
tara:strand:+ start:69 stop:752 length:684 start_codon:yes stop_codon:yes gene_type:complete